MGESTTDSIVDHFMKPIRDAFQTEGITPAYLAQKTREGLDADTIKAKLYKGDWLYSAPLTDNANRLKALEIALRVTDSFPNQKIDHTVKDESVEAAKLALTRLDVYELKVFQELSSRPYADLTKEEKLEYAIYLAKLSPADDSGEPEAD